MLPYLSPRKLFTVLRRSRRIESICRHIANEQWSTHWGRDWIYCAVSVALRIVARYAPEICEVVLAVTGLVVTVKVMLVFPGGMATCTGTLAAVVLLLAVVTTAQTAARRRSKRCGTSLDGIFCQRAQLEIDHDGLRHTVPDTASPFSSIPIFLLSL